MAHIEMDVPGTVSAHRVSADSLAWVNSCLSRGKREEREKRMALLLSALASELIDRRPETVADIAELIGAPGSNYKVTSNDS